MIGDNGHSKKLVFTRPPERVVSLVPSMTESMIDLGAGQYLAGVTDFCIINDVGEVPITRIGGTKSPDISKILTLKPELVIANQEENSKESVERLEKAGINLWVTFPTTVDAAIEILWNLSRMFQLDQVAGPKIKTLEMTLDWAKQASGSKPRVNVFCPIWMESSKTHGVWWMTFNQWTYMHSLLHVCGGENIFASRRRAYPLTDDLDGKDGEDPGERDTRYPRVTSGEVRELKPEVILLPNEPYAFDEDEVEKVRSHLSETPAVQHARIHLIDGSLLTWHGTRMARAISLIPSYLHRETDR